MIHRLTTTAGGMAIAAMLALGGCSGYGQTPSPAPNGGTAPAGVAAIGPGPADRPVLATPCNAQPAQFAVGQNGTASVIELARERSGAQLARLLRPGQIITKEFNAQRLNLEVDATGRIIAVRCG
ncbi:I78 family peptidase inhibitor [Acidovorax sp.]|uniref:I78 family peptidase inhibitor n=1 Tax=Acidovorax sp. TaxID=1872122 RepID=UPI00391F8240